jgi:hypothetical protein
MGPVSMSAIWAWCITVWCLCLLQLVCY